MWFFSGKWIEMKKWYLVICIINWWTSIVKKNILFYFQLETYILTWFESLASLSLSLIRAWDTCPYFIIVKKDYVHEKCTPRKNLFSSNCTKCYNLFSYNVTYNTRTYVHRDIQSKYGSSNGLISNNSFWYWYGGGEDCRFSILMDTYVCM